MPVRVPKKSEKPVQPVAAKVSEPEPKPPVTPEVNGQKMEVVYDTLKIVEQSISSDVGPVTIEDAKTILFWETEKEYQQRKVAEVPSSKPEHWIYGDNFHCLNTFKEKVRTWNNAHNRPFDENWCKDLIHTILNGQWAGPFTVPNETINGETVRISRYGRVLSGQHQLTALILADEYLQIAREKLGKKSANEKYPVWKDKDHPFIESIVITGLSEDPRVLMTIDYCKPRTAADVFYTSDVFKGATPVQRKELCRMLAAGTDLLWNRTDTKGYKTHPEIVGFLDRHKRLLNCVEHLFKQNSTTGGDGGRKISKLRLSPGQCAALAYIMGSAGPQTDGDVYRNESPPTEKGLDWSYWDQALLFWTRLANDASFVPVRMAIGRLKDSDIYSDDNQGMGGRLAEKLAILAKAWEAFKDHPETAGSPFTQEDLGDDGMLCLFYSDLDDKGNKMPDGKIKLLDIADFYGIDCPEVIDKSQQQAAPMPPPLSQEEIAKAAEAARLRREESKRKIIEARQSKSPSRKEVEADQTRKAQAADKIAQ